MSTDVTLHQDAHRYVVTVDGQTAGFLQIRDRPGLIAMIHTEVEPAFEGRGVGSTLIAAALDDARARGLAVLPFCPFVNAYIGRHAEYLDLVPEQYRKAFGL